MLNIILHLNNFKYYRAIANPGKYTVKTEMPCESKVSSDILKKLHHDLRSLKRWKILYSWPTIQVTFNKNCTHSSCLPFFVRSRSEKEFQKNINPVICICDNYLHYKWFTNYLLLFFFNKSWTVHINCQRSCHATTLTAANKTICVKCFRTADFACYWKEKLRYILQLMLWTQE